MWKEKVLDCTLVVLSWLVRKLVGLRYRLDVKGLDSLTKEKFPKSGGVLILPNHPAEIDPVILESVFYPALAPRPLVVEHFYTLKGFRWFMDLVKALPLPTMDLMANKWRAKKVETQFNTIVEALKKGENFLIYPSGRLKVTGLELIGGASLVHRLLQECPEVNVVLVRTTGLWGSQFSKALTGSSPDFGKVLWNCFKILLKNALFFTPRRKVVIDVELAKDLPIQASRLEFNKHLEQWYNRYPESGAEGVSLVSYLFWKKEFPTVYVSAAAPLGQEERPVPKKVIETVFSHLATLSGRSADQIERKMHLSQDLGLDSLDIAQLYVFLDEKYHVADLVPGDLVLVEDILQFAAGYQRDRGHLVKEKRALRNWPKEKERLLPEIPPGETLQEVFLRSARRHGARTACADALSQSLSYHKAEIAVHVLAKKFAELPGVYVGVMFPSSVGAYLIILALLLARKTPVMLNWTTGIKALDHAADLTELQTVITSSKFLDRLENGDLGKIEERFLFIEDVKEGIGIKEKLCAVFSTFRSVESLTRGIDPASAAVILFTSGTETLPKGVPLSHANLLSNQRAAVSIAGLKSTDVMYGILPPFHSFGFSVTGLLPLLAGLKVCYAPNPNDSHGLARDIAEWKPSLFCCAPSFVKALFQVAEPKELQSLRLVVVGAEKASEDLFNYVKEHLPNAQLIEGYGITECSPIVTIDRPDETHCGVGKPLPGVALITIDSATQEVFPAGKEGEVCIAGPNVFGGYLKNPKNPFVEIQGKRWYLSGDRGYLDDEGHLILSGRLKRFVKIGGEMVGLGGLEEELLRLAHEKGWIHGNEEGPPLAISVREPDSGKPSIVLFATFEISKEDVNTALKQSGLGRIVKIAEVRTLEQIPLTGTGKTHYRLLDEMK